MKYGHVEESELSRLSLTLPVDHPDTAIVLKGQKKKGEPAIYTGCAKWGRKEWEGMLYPSGIKEKDYLQEYVKHFNSIELNSTFYNMKKANVESWASQAPEGFKFCPKFSRRISHIKRLKLDDDFLKYFIDTTRILGDNLGLPFLMLPDNFGSKNIERMEEFLSQVPADYKMALEFRHEDWFSDKETFDAAFEILKKYKITSVITDVGARRDVLHMRLTTPVAFIRFIGYGINENTFARLDEWVNRLSHWITQGIQTIYFFPHQEDETFTPITCHYFIKKMNEVCGTELPLPEINESYL